MCTHIKCYSELEQSAEIVTTEEVLFRSFACKLCDWSEYIKGELQSADRRCNKAYCWENNGKLCQYSDWIKVVWSSKYYPPNRAEEVRLQGKFQKDINVEKFNKTPAHTTEF
jgi:hypothetical protein